MRERLCGQFAARNVAHVGESTYLTLDMHWDATVRYLAEVTGADVRPEDLTVVCVCREYQEGQHHPPSVDLRVYYYNTNNNNNNDYYYCYHYYYYHYYYQYYYYCN